MKIRALILTFSILVAMLFSVGYVVEFDVRFVGAAEDDSTNEGDDLDDKIDDLAKKIKEYEKKIEDLRRTESSLQKEIDYANSQISLTELRIQQSLAQILRKEEAILKLAGDIEDLKVRIEKLKNSISHQENVLSERLRARYKSREDSTVVVIFGSSTVNNLIQKTKYLQVMERQDKKLIDQMNATKDAFGIQKDLFEDKKEEEETLKQQLEVEKANLENYNAELERQKAQKNALLQQTQNDERKFQEMLANAQRELNQILNAVSILKDQKPRDVDKGDVIGIQGNTGYSFGEHLHFGVYRYSSFEDITGWNWYYSNHVNPSKKLKSKKVYWNTGCEPASNKTVGEGNWSWPVSDPTISQGYGTTCWSSVYYGGKPHPAYDMYGSYGAPVYAVEKGKAYFCQNCLGDGGNGVFIFHPDNYMTVYWHLR
jgi:peptidoglycan hydrolase CwlO-like protein